MRGKERGVDFHLYRGYLKCRRVGPGTSITPALSVRLLERPGLTQGNQNPHFPKKLIPTLMPIYAQLSLGAPSWRGRSGLLCPHHQLSFTASQFPPGWTLLWGDPDLWSGLHFIDLNPEIC